MANRKSITKQEIIDWFIIQRIRILNFIKEHKYISAVIGTFILSCIILLVAFANANDEYINEIKTTINSVGQPTLTESGKMKSFSTQIYDINYALGLKENSSKGTCQNNETIIRDNVIIMASYTSDKYVDAHWVMVSGQEYSAEYVKNGDIEDKTKLKLTVYSVKACETVHQQIYLKINNAEPGAKITTTISIVDGPTFNTPGYDTGLVATETKETIIESELVDLTPVIKGGKAYANTSLENGKLVPFGIILQGDINSLEGKYFNPNQEFDLRAVDNFKNELDLIIDDSKFYGEYASSNIIIDGMPDGVDSAGIEMELETSVSATTVPEITTVSTPNVKLNGEYTIELIKSGETQYVEPGIIIDGTERECKDSTNCEKNIKKLNEEEEWEDASEIDSVGEYQITYKYPKDSNTHTILTRTVYIIEEDSSETEVEPEITESQENSDTEEDVVVPIMKVESINLTNGQEINPVVYINDEKQSCDGDEFCNVYYYKNSSLKEDDLITEFDTQDVGVYYAKYVYSDESNGILLQAVNTITVSAPSKIHKLKLTNLKLSDDIVVQDGKIVLGAFFVTVKSPFSETSSSVEVTLTSGTASAMVKNYRQSVGTKINELTFNTDESGDFELLKENVVAYGQEVILKSSFNYMNDGDTNIETLTNKISLGNDFTLKKCATEEDGSLDICEYGTDNSALKYYLKINDKEIIKIDEDTGKPIYLNDGEESLLEELEELTFVPDVSGQEIGYTVTNISPGTIIEFRVRLITETLSNDTKLHDISSNVTYSQINPDNNEDDFEPNKTASIYITPFRARNKILINEYEEDTIVNGANVNKSKFSIYPSIILPANVINTNAVTVENIDAKIIVTLPEGINYIYNESYNIPSVSSDGRTLTYIIENVVVNGWIEPIVFEGSYDIDIPSGSELIIESEIQVTAKNFDGDSDDKTDISSKDLRTAKRKIIYQNDEEIAYSQYTTNSAVSRNEEFSIDVEVYNNTSDSKSNVEIITILPYNSETSSNFNGYYTSTFNSEAVCTSDVVTQESIKNNSITWANCEEFENDSNSENRISAIKTTYELIESRQKQKTTITINPKDNLTGDKYEFSSYVVIHNQNNISVSHIDNLTIDVVSKQISGIVWEDFDDDGVMADNEKRLSDVTLKLYDSSTDEMISSTLSDEDGKYTLSDLEDDASYYVVAEFNTDKYGITPRVGTNKAINSSFYSIEQQESSVLSNFTNSRMSSDDDIDGDGEPDDDGEYDDGGEYDGDGESDDDGDGELEEETNVNKALIRTDDIYISSNTKMVNNINLGLSLKKVYTVTLNKYITKAIVTNNIGVSTTKDYGKTTLAKLDVKDINNLNIKVIYTIELENTGYYPGYIYSVKDYIPDGMTFNESYVENEGWALNSDGYIENKSLSEDLMESGQKKYLTLALDISRKEAGSFINNATVDEEDLQMLIISREKGE